MNSEEISQTRLRMIAHVARSIWHSEYNTVAALREETARILDEMKTDLAIEPLCNKDAEVAVWGSGSFSTGKFELEQARLAKKEIGFEPTSYVAVVSNKEKSNARQVAEEFKLPLVQIDFSRWYQENYNPTSLNPIKETGLFFPPGSKLPDDIEHRFRVRKEFEETLLELLEQKTGHLPNSHSLRGYNFPIMHEIGQIDDTHPADMSFVDEKGVPIYPGWQSGATELMIRHGHKIFRGSLINVYPMTSLEQVTTVDTGELLMLGDGSHFDPLKECESMGIKSAGEYETRMGDLAKELQNAMKITEDYSLIAMKSWGLFPYVWGMSTCKTQVGYQNRAAQTVMVYQRAVTVGDEIRSGRYAFGLNLEQDLGYIQETYGAI